MYKKFIRILLCLIFIPFMLSAREFISGYKLLYSKLNETQLYDQKFRVNEEIFIASMSASGGIVLAGLGAVAGYIGVEMVTSDFIIDLDNIDEDLFMLVWPWVISAFAVQYLGGISLIVNGVGLCISGTGIAISACGNIAFQLEKKHQIMLELKRFQPVSYHDNPGYGIGISLPLNQKWHLR